MAVSSNDSTGDRLTDLLFKLPAELRNEIYELALPQVKFYVLGDSEKGKRRDRSVNPLKWLTCSRPLFADAASLFYSASCLYHCSRLSPSKDSKRLVKRFDHHIRTTYQYHDNVWLADIAGRMVREAVLDLRIDYEILEELPAHLNWYLEGMQEMFPNLRKLFLFVCPSFMDADVGAVHIRNSLASLERNWMKPESFGSGDTFKDGAARVDELCPAECEIRWRVSASFNVIDVRKTTMANSEDQKSRVPLSNVDGDE